MAESSTSDEKLVKITDILQKFWFLIFYFLILPFAISAIVSYVILTFVPGDQAIVTEIGFCTFFLLIIPLFLIFQIPFDKYRKKKLFLSEQYPTRKHIYFYFLGSLFSVLYTLLLDLVFKGLNYNFQLFFGEIGLFIRILFPLLTLVFLGFYYLTRRMDKDVSSLDDIENKSKEATLITTSLFLQAFYVIWFSMETLYPLLIINTMILIIFVVLFNQYFQSMGEAEPPIEPDKYLSFKELPFKIKTRVFFNIFPAIHIIISILLFLWNYGLADVSVSILVPVPMFGVALILKTIFFIYYYQLFATQYQEVVTQSKKTHIVNAFATILSLIAVILVLVLDVFNLINQVVSLVIVVLIFAITVVEGDRELISKKTYAGLTLALSVLFIIGIVIVIPLDLIFRIIILSILVYIDLEFLSRKEIVSREKTVVLQGFLLAAIIIELFYSLADVILTTFLPLENPIADYIFIGSSFTLAFCLASICLLLWFYATKLKRRSSKLLKISLIILHSLVTVAVVLLSALDIGNTWEGVSNEFYIIARFMLPLFLSFSVHILIFSAYGRIRVYERTQMIRIDVILLDLLFLISGISILTILMNLAGILILILLELLSLILHAVIVHQNQLIDDEKYGKIVNFIASVVLLDVVALSLVILIDILHFDPVLSLIITSLLTVVVIQVFNAIKSVFTRKFILTSNVVNFSIISMLLPIFLYSQSVEWFNLSMGSPFYWINSVLPLFALSALLLWLVFYMMSNGLLYSKFNILMVNLVFLVFYITLSLIPAFMIVLFDRLGIIILSDEAIVSFIIPTALIVFNLLIYSDIKQIEGLYNKPKVWITKAVLKEYINIKVGDDDSYNEKLIETLKLDEQYYISQENSGTEDTDQITYSISNTDLANVLLTSEDPKKILFEKNAFYKIIGHIGWISSILMAIFVSILINNYVTTLEWKIIAISVFTCGAVFNIINHMLRIKLISKNIFRKILVTNYIILLTVFVYVVFSLVQLLIPIDFDAVFGIILSLEAAVVCLLLIFFALRRQLVKYSPKFYYYGSSAVLTILSLITSSVIILLLNLPLLSISSTSFYYVLMSNPVFIIIAMVFLFSVFSAPVFRYLRGYNREILKDVSFTYEFPPDVLQDTFIVDEMKNIASEGIGSAQAEHVLQNYFKIKKLSKSRKIYHLLIYILSSLVISLIFVILGLWNPSLSVFGMILESILIFSTLIHLLIYLDKKKFNYLDIKSQNRVILISWLVLKVSVGIYTANLIENSFLSRILLSILIIVFLTQITNYYIKINNLKNQFWEKYGTLTIQIALVCISSVYLLDLGIAAVLNYSDYQILGFTGNTAFLYHLLPFLCIFIHISFYITYLGKKPTAKRFSRTFLFSLTALIIGISLMAFTDNLIDTFLTNGFPLNASFYENTEAFAIFSTNILLDIAIILTIGFAINYYYLTIPKQNIIVNFLHRFLCFFIGFLVFNSLIFDIFSILIGGAFTPASPSLFGSAGNPGILNFMWLERIALSYGLAAISSYYLQKLLKFEIYSGFKEQISESQLEVRFTSGINRSIGLSLTVLSLLNSFRLLNVFSLGMFGATGSFDIQLINTIDLVFILALVLIAGCLSFYYYIKIFLQEKEKLSYNIRFVLRIITILSIGVAMGSIIILYQYPFRYVTPFLLIAPYIYLVKFHRKHPDRAGITTGLAKGILFFIFIFWCLHFYLFGVAIINLNILNPSAVPAALDIRLEIELSLTIGIIFFILSRSIKNIPQKIRKSIIPSILITAVALLSYGTFKLLSSVHIFLYNSPIFVDLELAILLSIDMGIFLFYLAIGIYKWTLNRKEIWSTGWWLWTIFPIVNFNVLMKLFTDLDVITESLSIFGLFELDGSLILSLIIASILYFPIILYKLKNIFKYAFIVIWLESIGLWIWLSQNIYATYALSTFLTPLFIFGFTILSLAPLFYKLKYWKIVSFIWIFVAITNSLLFSFSIYITVIPDIILDIAIYLFIYGIFLMLFTVNPAIKEQWKQHTRGLIAGFLLTVAGLTLILYVVFYTVTSDVLFSVNLALIIIGIVLLSGKSSKLQIFDDKINWAVLVILAINSGLLVYRIVFLNSIFLINITGLDSPLDFLLALNPFAIGLSLSFATGIVLFSQYRKYISQENWRFVYLIFALSIAVTIASIIEALTLYNLNYYVAIIIGLFGFLSYPSLKLYKTSFWFIVSIGLTFFIIPNVINLSIFIFDSLLDRVLGLYPILWILCYLVLSVSVLFVGYRRYIAIKKEDRILLRELGLIDVNDNLQYSQEDIENYSSDKQEWLQKIYDRVQQKPRFFESKENYFRYVSFSLVLLMYIIGLLIGQIATTDLVYQLPIIILFVALGNFMAFRYSTKRSLIQNEILIDLIRLISATLLYFSLGYLISVFLNGLILLIFETFSVSPSISQQITGLLSAITLSYYLAVLVIEGNLNLYSKHIKTVLKVTLWTLFIIPASLFFYFIISNLLILFAIISLSLFNLSYHLKQFLEVYSEDIEVLGKDEQESLGIATESPIEPAAEVEEDLGIDQPSQINPPEEISDPDIFSEVDFSDIAESLDNLFDESSESSGTAPLSADIANTGSEQISSTISETLDQTDEEIDEDTVSQKLALIKRRQQRSQKLKRFIDNLDMFIRQSFVFELSYAIMLIILAIVPKNENFIAPFNYIFILFFFSMVLSFFYNHVKIVKKGLRVRVAFVIMIVLLISTIAMPFALYYVYGDELSLVGDGSFASASTPYLPNIFFLIILTIFGCLWEIQKLIVNYAETKNINIRNMIIDKWNAIIQPIMLILLSYIFANLFSYTQPFITRFTIASFILFGAILLDNYVFKLYNQFNRSRFLLSSWILCCILLSIQLIIIVVDYTRPISLSFVVLLSITLMQLVTIRFIHNYQKAKIIHQYKLTQQQVEKLNNDDKVAVVYKDELKIIAENQYNELFKSTKNLGDEGADNTIILKYRQFNDFKKKKFEIIAIVSYCLFGLFVCAEILENFLFNHLITLYDQYMASGEPLLSTPGSLLLVNILILFLIALSISFMLGYQDKFFTKLIRHLTRDIFLLINWILISLLLILIAVFVNNNYEITTNYISPLIFLALSLLQYYTMYLIGNIVLHSSKKYKINLLFSDEIVQFPDEYKDAIMEIMGYIPDWEYLDETSQHKEKRAFLMELLAALEPKKIKIIQTINAILGIVVYFFIGFSSFIFFNNLTKLLEFSVLMSLIIIYLQAELNYYKIKTFSEKYNYLFSLVSWIIFSVVISILPLLYWGESIIIDDLGFWFEPIPFKLTDLWFLSLTLLIFNLSMFYSVKIVRRYYTSLDVKLKWYKYLRVTLYFTLSFSIFSFLYYSSLLFAIAIASLFNYLAFNSEQKRPILVKKTFLVVVEAISGLIFCITIGTWTFQYISIELLLQNIGFLAGITVFTALFPLIYNPFKRKKYIRLIYWLILAIEIGFLIGSISTIPPFVGAISSVVFGLMYILIFEIRRLINLIKMILEFFRDFFVRFIEIMKNIFNKLWKFLKEHKDVIYFMIAAFAGVLVFIFIKDSFSEIVQGISISILAFSVLLYPLFNREKDELKNEKTFSRQLYYAILVYATANFSLFSFVSINIIWGLLSSVILSTIILVVIYRRETMYNLSVKWRFSALLVTIALAVIMIVIIVLFALGNISINF